MSAASMGTVRVFGSPRIDLGANGVWTPPPHQQLLLGLLASEPGRALSFETLIDEMWGERPPMTARQSLANGIGRLRRGVRDRGLAGSFIETLGDGYRLEPEIEVDLSLTARYVELGAIDDTNAERLGSIWAAEPFQGLDAVRLVGARARADLSARRFVILRARQLLRSGRASDAVEMIEEALVLHRYAEDLWVLLALAAHVEHGPARAEEVLRRAVPVIDEIAGPSGDRLRVEVDLALLGYTDPSQGSVLAVAPTPTARSGNLRPVASSFIGRRSELDRLCEHLDRRTIVTLTGPGGVGKTRLAIEAATSADRWPDGRWICQLAEVDDDSEVVPALASVLAIRSSPRRLLDALVERLQDLHCLVLLDNCEHVAIGTAELLAELSTRLPSAVFLATSREALGVRGERVVPLGPLAPEEATELFIERATDADASFETDTAGRAVVARICRRLDNGPLAIELAAAHIDHMALGEIERRLGDRFAFLQGGRYGDQVHHRSLAEMVRWSADTLDDPARALFHRLSVFAGSFDLEAVVEVCPDDVEVHRDDIPALVARLVKKSMLSVERGPEASRFSLLETFREFGQLELQSQGTLELWRHRHLERQRSVVAVAATRYETEECALAVSVFENDWANIRAAFGWAVESGRIDVAETLLASVAQFAFWSGVPEVATWAETLSAQPASGFVTAAVRSLLAGAASDYPQAEEAGLAALESAPPLDPSRRMALHGLQLAYHFGGRPGARDLADLAWLSLAEQNDDAFSLAVLGGIWQFCHLNRREMEPSLSWIDRTDALNASLRNPVASAYGSMAAAAVFGQVGRHEEALERLNQARLLAVQGHARLVLSALPLMEATIWRAIGDHDRYRATLGHAFREMVQDQNWANCWAVVERLAHAWWAAGRRELGVTVVGYLMSRSLLVSSDLIDREPGLLEAIASPGAGERISLRRGATMTRSELVGLITEQLTVDAGS